MKREPTGSLQRRGALLSHTLSGTVARRGRAGSAEEALPELGPVSSHSSAVSAAAPELLMEWFTVAPIRGSFRESNPTSFIFGFNSPESC